MPLLSFSVVGDREVLQGLTMVRTRLQDMRPWWREVFAPRYLANVQSLFQTGGRARGGDGRFKSGAWAPLSPAYRVWKARNYPGRPILVREGDLKKSLEWRGGSIGPKGLFDAQRTSVTIGTSVPHGQYHMTGTKHMPARPFMPPPNMAVFRPLLARWILRGRAEASA